MAVYYTIRCPHCKGVVEKGKNRREQYGSPFKICPHCHNAYFDENFVEPGLISEKEVKRNAFSWGNVFYAIVGAAFLVGGCVTSEILLIVIGVIVTALAVVAIVISLKYDPQKDSEFQQKLLESRNRLSDPKYVIALYEAGYYIPATLLSDAKKTLNYKTKAEISIEKMKSGSYDPERYKCKSFKYLSEYGEGKCMMCFRKDILKKYRIKNDIGSRDIPVCNECIDRLNTHSNQKQS